jgi:hypothetical protein
MDPNPVYSDNSDNDVTFISARSVLVRLPETMAFTAVGQNEVIEKSFICSGCGQDVIIRWCPKYKGMVYKVTMHDDPNCFYMWLFASGKA